LQNLKWGLVAGFVAFFLSIILGLVNGVHFSNLMLRASLFLIIFFIFGVGIRVAATRLDPELLNDNENGGRQDTFSEAPAPSRVNITLDDSYGYAIPGTNADSRNPEEVGNIEDLVMGVFKPSLKALDRSGENGYNAGEGDSRDSPIESGFGFPDSSSLTERGVEKKPAQAANFLSSNLENDPAGLGGGLLDFEAMASIFSSGSKGDSGQEQSQSYEMGVSPRKPQGNKPEQLKGDFSPQEIAKGISTVLSKEKEGKV
jgi:hypothetical protein